jgi:hypothetical protein
MSYYSFDKFKFINFLLIIILAVILEQKFFAFGGVGFNFLLINLVVLSLFASYLEIVFLSLFGIFLINYAPQINKEIIILFILPQIVYFFAKKFNWQSWFAFFVFGILSFLAFYFLINFNFIFKNSFYFFYDLAVSFGWGILLFLILKKIK